MSSTPLALFVGLPNPTISDDEFALFRETNPLGLFVGRRNQREPEQTRRLIDRFREAVGRDDAPVFTDQEGGRVQHLDAGPVDFYAKTAGAIVIPAPDKGIYEGMLRSTPK